MLWASLLKHLNTSVNDSLIIQNQLLKAQIRELQRQLPSKKRLLFSIFSKQDMARLAKQLSPQALEDACVIIRPSTLLRWYRTLVAAKFDGSKKRSYPGRPRIRPESEALIVEIACSNPRWGADRIQGALAHLAIYLCPQTILNVLKRNGIHPAPTREGNGTWAQFIKSHRDVTVATDFLSHEVLTMRGLVTYYILFFINLGTRQVKVAGISNHPNGVWMEQIARNITMADEPFFANTKFVIHDRDAKYCNAFCHTLKQAGIKTIKLPVLSPNLNAYAERWVRSIKAECLNHLILLGKKSLEKAVHQYVLHYNCERTHQGIDNRIPQNWITAANTMPNQNLNSPVLRSERLGGLLQYYYRAN
jgi:transposase InsO family protein